MELLASQIMNQAAILLNDKNRSNFTYAVQIPYLNMALMELQELCELNNIPITNRTDTTIEVPVGVTEVIFNAVPPNPSLPRDLIDIREVLERAADSTESYIPLARFTFLPSDVLPINQLCYFSWENQKLKFIGATSIRQVKLEYIGSVFIEIKDKDDPINMINAASFLQYRVAALISQFVGENESRAGVLNQTAQLALDRSLGISIKGSQAISTRRRPFNQSWKLRSGVFR